MMPIVRAVERGRPRLRQRASAARMYEIKAAKPLVISSSENLTGTSYEQEPASTHVTELAATVPTREVIGIARSCE